MNTPFKPSFPLNVTSQIVFIGILVFTFACTRIETRTIEKTSPPDQLANIPSSPSQTNQPAKIPSLPGQTNSHSGGVDGGGGDTRAAEFLKIAKQIGTWAQENCSRAITCVEGKQILEKANEFESELSRATRSPIQFVIVTVSSPLVDAQGVPKMAVFSKTKQNILVDEHAWSGLSNIAKFKLVGLEMMGILEISNRYQKIAEFEEYESKLIVAGDRDETSEFWYKHSRLTNIFAMFRESPTFAGGGRQLVAYPISSADGKEWDQTPPFLFDDNLFNWEKSQSALLAKALRGLKSSHPSYLFDLYVGGLTVSSGSYVEGNGVWMTTYGGFQMTSRNIALQIFGYLDQIKWIMKVIVQDNPKKEASNPDSLFVSAISNRLEKIQNQIGRYTKSADEKNMTLDLQPIFTKHLDLLLGNLRNSVRVKNCEVPLIASFSKESARALVNSARPRSENFEELEVASFKALAEIRVEMDSIGKDWEAFVYGGGLDRMGRSTNGNRYWGNLGPDTVSMLNVLNWVYLNSLDRYGPSALEADRDILQDLQKQVSTGALCLKVAE